MKTLEFKPDKYASDTFNLREELIDDAHDALLDLRNANTKAEASWEYIMALNKFRRSAESLGALECPEMPEFDPTRYLRIPNRALGLLIMVGSGVLTVSLLAFCWFRFLAPK